MGVHMDIQRLRNLTTGRLHTEIGHIYEDLETITGEKGLMTHMLPRVCRAVEPWLRQHVTDSRFWNDEYDRSLTGTIELPEPSEDDRKAMLQRFLEQPNPLAGKTVIPIVV
jgi:hypothetical protein